MVTYQDISATLFGKTRRAVLTLLLSRPEESFYLREIARLTETGLGGLQRELKSLVQAGIIIRRKEGNQTYYQADKSSPVFSALKNILLPTNETSYQPEIVRVTQHELSQRFNIFQDWLAEFCRRFYIRRLSLYGSVLRTDFRPDSDIDILVEFKPGHTPGLFKISDMEFELSAQLNHRLVDIRTPQDLSRRFRQQVVREARAQYADAR